MQNKLLKSHRPQNADFLYSIGQKRKVKMMANRMIIPFDASVGRDFYHIARFEVSVNKYTQKTGRDHAPALSISDDMPVSGGGGEGSGGPDIAAPDDDDDGGDSDGEPARRPTPPHKKHPSSPALLAFASLSHYVSLGRSRIYGLIADGEFPKPIKIGKSSRWIRAEIDTWISHQSQQRAEV